MNDSILTNIINQYTGSISNIQTGSTNVGLSIFNSIAAIAIAILALNHLLRRNIDMVDSNFELIRMLIYLNFFYYFIVNYNTISQLFLNGVNEIGNLLGADASGMADITSIKPADLMHIGFMVAKNMWTTNVTFNLFKDFQVVLIAIFAGGVVLFCFAAIGLELILVQIGSKIILAGGIFLLALSGMSWTRDYAERYVHTFFHIGIKMIFIYILVGIGIGLAKTWPQNVPNTSDLGKIMDYDIAVALSAYIYYKLCLKVPDQAVSWLTGRLSMGFDTATDVKAAAKGAFKAASTVISGGAAMGLEMQGMDKAVGAARQTAQANLQSLGKKDTFWNRGAEGIKTLGQAASAIQQEARDKKIDATFGGKMAKQIAEDNSSVEKAKTEPEADVMEYSI